MALTKIPASFLDKSAHVDFADNEKIRLGTSQDLQIYHDASNSYIKDQGDGQLVLDGNAVILQYSSGTKFETTSTGASVTGNLAVSGNLTVSGTTTELDTTNLNVTDKNITLNYHASSDTSSNADGAGITIQDAIDASNDATLNWSAANDRFVMSHGLQVTSGNVGIGTTSPEHPLHVYDSGSNNTGTIKIGGSAASLGLEMSYTQAGNTTASILANPTYTNDDALLKIAVDGDRNANQLVLNGIGNVGIGTNNPLGPLSVGAGSINDASLAVQISTGADGTQAYYGVNRNGGYAALYGYSASSTYKGLIIRNVVAAGTANADGISFMTNNTSMRMHITGDGKVGIGTASPSNKLHLKAGASGASSFDSRYNLTMEDDGENYIGMYVPNNSYAGIRFVNAANSIRGNIDYYHGTQGDKMNLYAQNQIEFGYPTVGVQHVFKADGKVGIGTNNPVHKLDVRDGTIFAGRLVSDEGSISYTNTAAAFSSRGVAHTDSRSNVLRLLRDGTSGVVYAGYADFDLSRWETNGVYSRTALTIKLGHGNAGANETDVMTLRSNGNVGIGTSSPPSPLSIFGTGTSSPTAANAQQSYDNALFRINSFDNSSVGLSIGSTGSNVTHIQTSYNEGTTSPLVLNPFGGNVGIGTTSPQTKLHLFGTDPVIRVSDDGTGGFATLELRQQNTSSEGFEISYNSSTGHTHLNNVWGSGDTVFGTATGSFGTTTTNVRMKITHDGHVTMPNQPSFMIGSMQSSAGNVWTSPKTFHNNGSHFNTSNGRFTAPIAGFYFFFHWGMLTTGTGAQDADVYHRLNGTRTQAGTAYSGQTGGNYNQFSCSYIVQMAVNDYADVFWGSGTPYGTSDGRHGAYGGYLIG